MLIIGLILNLLGIGIFCWLIFTLAVYALPFSVALTAGIAAFHSGAGVAGAFLVGVVADALTLGIGQMTFALARPMTLRVVIAAGFALPAAIAGYYTVLGLSQIGVPSLFWRELFAWIGAIVIGCTTWARITILEPLPLQSGHEARSDSQRVLTAATHEGYSSSYRRRAERVRPWGRG